ncbi:sulfatase [Sphingomonas koreensis]|uniref:sulfatase-like hydrolase/transferase n=1 Tax=Sphingomonas koreensis TaxID=93064 RepID=UPI000836689D|nr:sulfatase-like hydrolase/transferase [Sphingomonas koreensis]PJI88853.1 glucan phosphoethanolaminetransferase (alkaline phosphatase superfamily) [Sphingomonas koreensis]RSU63544.1 sulfatase [Sphingomonas koreensis]RSU64404.1 sulfatase [Sphingomonas koreensis]
MQWLQRAPVKEALLILYLVADGGNLADRVVSLGLSPWLGIFTIFYVAFVGALWVASRLASNLLRWAIGVLLFAATAFIGASERILGDHLTYDGFLNLIGSAGFAGDAMAEHGVRIGAEIFIALPLLFAIGFAPRRTRRFDVRWAAVPLGALALLTGMLFLRGGEGARGLPGAFTALAYLTLATGEELASDGKRRPVTLVPRAVAGMGDIVLIIDESVSARYLDLIDPAGVRTGLLTPPGGIAVHSFGVAAAITNCSLGTNLTLRHGGTRDRYGELNATGPAIWDYARKAGFAPVYIDAQRTGGGLHNGMDAAERARIDTFVQLDSVPVGERDAAAADRIVSLLANGRREFILVNKVGAHFPVHDKYPDSHAVYRPALPRGRFLGIADTGDRDGFDGDAEQWRRYRNAYRNTLLWKVGGFFERLLAPGTLNGATVIYTSDHGQDLRERGGTGVHTHCSAHPVPEEGAVPLAVLTDAGAADRWPDAAQRNRDRSSHYQLFPTILEMMGYPESAVRAEYGMSLHAPLADELRFNTHFNARLGRKPQWQRIDVPALARPPRGDGGPAVAAR